ncbi:MAG: B12-binding domain-containing protein [Chlorobi bacterium]|nr:B12-binding domain-containing protein [Chlorobiota bacterium]
MAKVRRCVYDPLAELIAYYAEQPQQTAAATSRAELPVEERLKQRIVHGDRIGIERDLDEALQRYSALQIINDILLEGMRVVGDLFGSGQMQLPFVLQAAETMKAAVAYLEPHMERVEDSTPKGTIVLATVKGDVHDIGKNLVDIILSNNGYRVINLGIKVPLEQMLQAVEEHNADAIGMSGLLVKSTAVMKENLETMEARGIRIPVVLGGAALNRRFVEQDLRAIYSGKLAYAQDAFDGLRFMEELRREKHTESIASPTSSLEVSLQLERIQHQRADQPVGNVRAERTTAGQPVLHRVSAVRRDVPIPVPPFWGSRVVEDIPLEHVFAFVNENALFRGQWQFRRGRRSEEEFAAIIEREARPAYNELKLLCKRERLLQPKVVYGYFPCQSEGDDLVVYRPAGRTGDALYEQWSELPPSRLRADDAALVVWVRFRFPRQREGKFLCIADFFRPVESGEFDVVAFHVVTIGDRATPYAQMLFESGRYRDYLFFHGLSVESAEGLAEYWHKIVRTELGIADRDAPTVKELFVQGYQGSRYSFGYPACPNLEDQALIMELLRPERIGITLTEEYELVPEQSTSALICHHPEARYFSVR